VDTSSKSTTAESKERIKKLQMRPSLFVESPRAHACSTSSARASASSAPKRGSASSASGDAATMKENEQESDSERVVDSSDASSTVDQLACSCRQWIARRRRSIRTFQLLLGRNLKQLVRDRRTVTARFVATAGMLYTVYVVCSVTAGMLYTVYVVCSVQYSFLYLSTALPTATGTSVCFGIVWYQLGKEHTQSSIISRQGLMQVLVNYTSMTVSRIS
jgi:hypothetical protein